MASSTLLRFTLTIQGQPADRFRVQTFTLDEHISEPFRLDLSAVCDNPDLTYDDLISKPATLTVSGDDFSVKHQGMVTAFTQHPDHSQDFGHEAYVYEMVIEPRVKALEYAGQNRVFQEKKVDEIVKEVLEAHGLQSSDFEFRLSGSYPKQEFTVQYNETDLNFVQRLLEDKGIFYFFEHGGNSEKLIFADATSAYPPLEQTPSLIYQQEAGLSHMQQDHITKVFRQTRFVSAKALVKDYNERTPDVNLFARATGQGGLGEVQTFSPGTLDVEAATKWAAACVDRLQSEKVVLRGEGIARAMRTGHRFELDDGVHSPFEGKYMLVSVRHMGDQREGFETNQVNIIYTNAFVCVPASVNFKAPFKAKRPKVSGVITARVDGPQSDYAHLDEQGRYHVKLPFDLSDLKDGKASLPVRLSQPYAGPGYGLHTPVHNDNDFLLAFIDGDIDRPVALGAMPNPMNQSPVNSRNHSQSILRTASGHEFKLDDLKDKTIIEMTTSGKHKLALNDDKDKKEIHLTTTDLNEMVFDDTNENIRIATTEGGHLIKLDNKNTVMTLQTKYGHIITLDDAKKTMALQTKEGHILKISDEDKMIALQDGDGKHVLQFDIGGSKVALTTEGDMELTAKGSLNITAKEITMEAKQGAISAKAQQDVKIEGMNVNAKGKQNLALEGGIGASVKGTQVTLEAKAKMDISSKGQTQVSGLQTSIQGQAMAEVKGPMVMIN
jgi:type VI secretion system secreted protein VgrG